MNQVQQFFAVFFLFYGFVACGPSQREKAVWKINEGKQILLAGDTLKAISTFDSIKVLYPKANVQIGVCKNINADLYRQLIDQKMKSLSLTDTLIAQLKKDFLQERTENDKYLQYIPKSQLFERSWNRSFLEVHLDERGEMYLSSNYMGKDQLNHTSIRVYDGGLQAKSEEVELGNPLNHRSDFMEIKWEKVSYMNGKADAVIQFIASHRDLKLKCVFLGNRQYFILLEGSDIKAVCDAFALSNAIKYKKSLTEGLKKLENKRNY